MSNPNKAKAVLSTDTVAQALNKVAEEPKVTSEPVEFVEEVVDEPIQIAKDEFVSIAGLASAGREKLLDALRAHAEKNKVEEYVPPTPTERQKTQTQLEQEAGRKAVARHTAQAANRPQPKPDATEGYTTPVYRPGDHVPGMNSAPTGARNIR